MENVSKKTFRIASIAVAIVILLSAVIALIVVSHQGGESDAATLVKSLNTTLDAKEETVSITNVLDAISVLKDAGVEVSSLSLSGDEMIVYNATTNRMVCYSGGFSKIEEGSVSKGDTLVVIDYTLKSASSATAQGITDYAVWAESSITLSSSASINIWLYQDGTDSVINTPNATIYAYGSATNVELEAVAADSYHLYGSADYIALGTGHIELTSSAKVGEILIKDVSGEETTTQKITVTNGAQCDYIIDNSTTTEVSYYYKESDTAEASSSNLSSACEAAGSVQTGTIENISGYGTALYPYLANSTSDLTSIISTTSNAIYVRLEANLTGANFVIEEGQNVTLDLNGYNITGGLGTEKNLSNNVVFYNCGTLTINGSGTITCYGTGTDAAVYGETGSTTYLNGGTYIQGAWYLIHNYGTMVIDGATIQGSNYVSSVVHNGYYNSSDKTEDASDNVTMTINSGTFTNSTTRSSTGSENSSSLIKNDCYGYLTINDGTFTDAPAYILLNWNVCTVNGGEFTRTELTNQLIYNGYADDDVAKGQLTIYGGIFTYPSSTSMSTLYNYSGATTSIYGGSFQVKPSETYIKTSYGYVADGLYTYTALEPARSTYEAYGIVGNSSSLKVTYYYQDADDCFADESIVYYGTLYLYGTFDGGKTVNLSSSSALVIALMSTDASLGDLTIKPNNAGYAVESSSETVEGAASAVSYIAIQSNSTAYAYILVDNDPVYYSSIEDAVSAASAGDTIYINNDIDLGSSTTISISKSVTIDLQGHTITSSRGSNYGMFKILNDIDVIFTDSEGGGKITNTATSGAYTLLLDSGSNSADSTLYVDNSVTLSSPIRLASPTASLYLPTNSTAEVSYLSTTNYNNRTKTIDITINQQSVEVTWYYRTASTLSEDDTETANSAAQAYVIKNSTTIYYTMTYAITQKQTIYLIADLSVTSSYTLYKDVTLDLNGHTMTSSKNTFKVSTDASLTIKNTGTGGGSVSTTYSTDYVVILSSGKNANITIESGITLGGYIKLSYNGATANVSKTATFADGYSVIFVDSIEGCTSSTDTTSDSNYNIYKVIVTSTTAAAYITDDEGNTTYYATFAEAVTAAGANTGKGNTIYLNKDITTTSYFSIGKSLTLDLNGHTITTSTTASTSGAVNVNATGITVTIINSGNAGGLVNSNSASGNALYVKNCTVIIKGATITGNITIYGSDSSVYIYNCTFDTTTYSVVTNTSGYEINSETISDADSDYNGYTKYSLVEETTEDDSTEG